MRTWLKDNGTVIGALAGALVAFVAILQLAVVGPMNRGFADLRTDMNARFGDLRSDMNARFDIQDKYIEARFDAVDQGFEAVNQRFEAVNQRFNQQDKRIDDLESNMNRRLEQLADELATVRSLVVGIGERVSRNEGAITVIREQLQAEGDTASPRGP